MAIQQINASYIAEEDRLLLRITTAKEEYRLWLTRAVAAKFLDVSDKLVVDALAKQHPQVQAQAIAEFQEEALAAKENFSQAFKPVDELPLGSAPQLVLGINATVDGEHCLLGLQLGNRRTLTLHLRHDLLVKTKLLLKKIVVQAQWFSPSGWTSSGNLNADAPQSASGEQKIFH